MTKGRFSIVQNKRSFGIVEIRSSNGQLGYAEVYASLYSSHKMLIEAFKEASQILDGVEISSFRDFRTKEPKAFISRAGIVFNAWIAIETALYDLCMKEKLFESTAKRSSNNRLRTYYSGGSNLMTDRELEEEYIGSIGLYDGYKFRIGLGSETEHVKKILSIAKVMDSRCNWMVDSIAESRRRTSKLQEEELLIKMARDAGAYWFEEPIKVGNLTEYQYLCDKFPRFIAAGEALSSNLEVESFRMLENLGWLQLDFTHNISIFDFIFPSPTPWSHTDKLAIHCWGSKLSYRISFLIATRIEQVKWVEKSAVEYDLDEFFQDPLETDSALIPSEQVAEMIQWFKKQNRHSTELIFTK